MSTQRPMVEVRGARKSFGAVEVLKGIDLSVERGQIVAIIGPSGSGKSTLLRSINHLETLNGGEVWLDGVQVNQKLYGQAFERHINEVRQQMGMVFQHFNLFPHLTVIENITMGPVILKGMAKADAQSLGAWPLVQGRARRQDRRLSVAGFPAGRSSAWRSRVRWPCSPR